MTDWGRFDEPSEIARRLHGLGRGTIGLQRLRTHPGGLRPIDEGQRTAAVSLRYADGGLQRGSQSLVRDYVDEVMLSFSTDGADEVRHTGKGLDTTLTPDPEWRYLFDRDFCWQPRTPINR